MFGISSCAALQARIIVIAMVIVKWRNAVVLQEASLFSISSCGALQDVVAGIVVNYCMELSDIVLAWPDPALADDTT